jgi:hypothetical protein
VARSQRLRTAVVGTLAYCYASGHIEFGARCPDGALPIVRGDDRRVREFVAGVARHGYDGETLLVPGVPEAENERAALEKLVAWIERIKPAARRDGLIVR